MAVLTPYERIPYSNHPYRQAHHDQVAVAGLLHGLEPPPPATARVLEIGCGAGGHLLATAFAMPGVEAVGVDLAPSVIDAATREARAAGVGNVRFEAADVRDLTDGRLGEFDYVVAHGVHAWIPNDARDALMEAVRAHLAPEGLGYVSFNAHPGGHLRDILRDACLFHARDAADDHERLVKAREMLELLQRWRASDEEGDAYGQFLLDVLPRQLEASDGTLTHDLLSVDSEPTWYADFAADAARVGLRPVAESRLIEPQLLPRTARVRDAIVGLAGDDVVAREQLVDLFGHGRFRETVLAHEHARPRAHPDPGALVHLSYAAPPPPAGLPAGPVVEVIEAIAERRPVACGVGDLIGVAGLDPPHLAGALLEGMRAGLLTAWLEPPRAVPAGERPRASALARHQARSGQPATSLLHTVVVLDPAGAQLLDLLDGTRDAAAIAIDLQAATGIELPPDAVASNLHAFGVAGLLEGDGP